MLFVGDDEVYRFYISEASSHIQRRYAECPRADSREETNVGGSYMYRKIFRWIDLSVVRGMMGWRPPVEAATRL